MSAHRHKILNIAKNESFLESRSTVLENAGYEVVSVLDLVELRRACEARQDFDLVIIGHSLPKAEKRRTMTTVRNHCGRDVPILELYHHDAGPVDEEAEDQLAAHEEPALLDKVAEILAKPRKRRRGA